MSDTRSNRDNAGARGAGLRGDRLCIHCFYNLKHQPTIHDRELNLFIVRCPECGAAAALDDHPALGRWERSAARALAIAWTLTLIVLVLMAIIVISGLCMSTAFSAPRVSFSRAGSWFGAMHPVVIVMWLVVLAAATSFGMLLRFALYDRRPLLRWLLPAAVLACGGSLCWSEARTWLEPGWNWQYELIEAGLPALLIAGAAAILGMALGQWLALSVARWCFRRFLLPARLHSMSPL